jgi:hypothetical protein
MLMVGVYLLRIQILVVGEYPAPTQWVCRLGGPGAARSLRRSNSKAAAINFRGLTQRTRMGDEIAKDDDANRSIYKCLKQPGAVYDREDFSLLIFTFDQEKKEMLNCSMTIQWVDPGNEQSRKIISSHAAREGIRKIKRARQTKLVKSAVVLNRPLPWRKLPYQPMQPDRHPDMAKPPPNKVPVGAGVFPITKESFQRPPKAAGQDSAQRIFWEFHGKPQSLLGAGRVNPFGTYPVSSAVVQMDRLLDFGESFCREI